MKDLPDIMIEISYIWSPILPFFNFRNMSLKLFIQFRISENFLTLIMVQSIEIRIINQSCISDIDNGF